MKKSYRLQRRYNSSTTLNCIENESKSSDVLVQCGWGKLIFAHTFKRHSKVISALKDEKEKERNIAIYVKEPQIINILSNDIFLDPSITYRLEAFNYIKPKKINRKFTVRYLNSIEDAKAVNRIYKEFNMIEVSADVMLYNQRTKAIDYFVAEDLDGNIIGTIMGINHSLLFDEKEKGSSFWSLAVTNKTNIKGIGQTLIRYVAERYFTAGCSYLDLSVIYSNKRAIELYKKMNFKKVPVFCMKHKNSYNSKIIEELN